VKELIKIVKSYGTNGKISYNVFQKLAREEDIVDNKFQVHFNQACFLGYLKRQDNHVYFLMDYD
jgi:hypothetical protein